MTETRDGNGESGQESFQPRDGPDRISCWAAGHRAQTFRGLDAAYQEKWQRIFDTIVNTAVAFAWTMIVALSLRDILHWGLVSAGLPR